MCDEQLLLLLWVQNPLTELVPRKGYSTTWYCIRFQRKPLINNENCPDFYRLIQVRVFLFLYIYSFVSSEEHQALICNTFSMEMDVINTDSSRKFNLQNTSAGSQTSALESQSALGNKLRKELSKARTNIVKRATELISVREDNGERVNSRLWTSNKSPWQRTTDTDRPFFVGPALILQRTAYSSCSDQHTVEILLFYREAFSGKLQSVLV